MTDDDITHLTKVRRYTGSTTVIGTHYSSALAAEQAADYNHRYQTDAAYVEPWKGKHHEQ